VHGIRCEYVHVRSEKTSMFFTIPCTPSLLPCLNTELPAGLISVAQNNNVLPYRASALTRMSTEQGGANHPGMSKTWMFSSSVHGRIHSVPRTVRPALFPHQPSSQPDPRNNRGLAGQQRPKYLPGPLANIPGFVSFITQVPQQHNATPACDGPVG